MCSATEGAAPVHRCTWAASAIFSRTVLAVPGGREHPEPGAGAAERPRRQLDRHRREAGQRVVHREHPAPRVPRPFQCERSHRRPGRRRGRASAAIVTRIGGRTVRTPSRHRTPVSLRRFRCAGAGARCASERCGGRVDPGAKPPPRLVVRLDTYQREHGWVAPAAGRAAQVRRGPGRPVRRPAGVLRLPVRVPAPAGAGQHPGDRPGRQPGPAASDPRLQPCRLPGDRRPAPVQRARPGQVRRRARRSASSWRSSGPAVWPTPARTRSTACGRCRSRNVRASRRASRAALRCWH